jgi:hypothetical protein
MRRALRSTPFLGLFSFTVSTLISHRLSIRTIRERLSSVQVMVQLEIRRCYLSAGLEGHVGTAVVEDTV